jgi:hypothetical protein
MKTSSLGYSGLDIVKMKKGRRLQRLSAIHREHSTVSPVKESFLGGTCNGQASWSGPDGSSTMLSTALAIHGI